MNADQKDRVSQKKSYTWLITGGCGFIGTRLIEYLIRDDRNRIVIFDNLSTGTRDDLSAVCSFIETDRSDNRRTPSTQVQLCVGDIRDQEACVSASKNTDIIVHLAANTGVGPSVENPQADMEHNIIGTFNMLEAARINNVKRFIFASSSAPIGECNPPIHEELAPHPVSPYGASKLAGEGYCSAYYRTFGVETVMLRFGNVYGPGSGHKNSVVAKFIKQAIGGEKLEIYGDGSQTRDFIYVTDLVKAIILASSAPDIGGETFQIATNREHTVNEVAELLKQELDARYNIKLTITHGSPRLGDVMRNYSDTSKAERMLGWKSGVNLSQGIVKTVNWFL